MMGPVDRLVKATVSGAVPEIGLAVKLAVIGATVVLAIGVNPVVGVAVPVIVTVGFTVSGRIVAVEVSGGTVVIEIGVFEAIS